MFNLCTFKIILTTLFFFMIHLYYIYSCPRIDLTGRKAPYSTGSLLIYTLAFPFTEPEDCCFRDPGTNVVSLPLNGTSHYGEAGMERKDLKVPRKNMNLSPEVRMDLPRI
jgi:hypothetical protein